MSIAVNIGEMNDPLRPLALAVRWKRAKARPFGERDSLMGEMRTTLGCSLIAAVVLVGPAAAQRPATSVSLDAIRSGLQRSTAPLITRGAAPPTGVRSTRLGVLTLIPPDTTGEMVNVAIPVGELTTRAIRVVTSARHRRAERAAERRVREDLRAFQAKQPQP